METSLSERDQIRVLTEMGMSLARLLTYARWPESRQFGPNALDFARTYLEEYAATAKMLGLEAE